MRIIGGDATLDLDAPWRSLGLDSIDVLEIAVACEESYGAPIPDRELLACRTPGDVLAWFEQGGLSLRAPDA